MKLKIGFTYDSKDEYKLQPGDPPDKFAEFDGEQTISQIESALRSGGHSVSRIGSARKLVEKICAGEKWDFVFNICEGVHGRNRESQAPAILDLYDIPYLGSDAFTMALTLDKSMAKKIIQHDGIKTPGFMCVSSPDELSSRNFKLRFPIIVKPSQEGTSKGLSEDSRVRNFRALKKQVKWVIDTYREPAIIEEFIVGYEFTILVIGNNPPQIMPPVQITINSEADLGEDFYTHSRVESSEIKYHCPRDLDKNLENKLHEISLNSYNALGCRDLSRIDVRVDYNNDPYFLECNPLPNMGLVDVFPIVAKSLGITYADLIQKVLKAGLKRHGLES